MTMQTKKNKHVRPITFLNIDCDSSYFDTREQVSIKKMMPATSSIDISGQNRFVLQHTTFLDATAPSVVSGSSEVSGLFSKKRVKNVAESGLFYYPTGSASVDPSGADRKFLASNIDFYVSSSIDSYRNGIEISQEKHWTKGLVKITAGTPGHLLEKTLYGVPDVSIYDPDIYLDILSFNPVAYLKKPRQYKNSPVVIGDPNDADTSIMNGIIETFPIRAEASFNSLFFPNPDPHGFRAAYESGNCGRKNDADGIVTSYEWRPDKANKVPWLDASDSVFLEDDFGRKLSLGPMIGYFIEDDNPVKPWADSINPRNDFVDYLSGWTTSVFDPVTGDFLYSYECTWEQANEIYSVNWWWQGFSPQFKGDYSPEMRQALKDMMISSKFQTYTSVGETYVSQNQKSATKGFFYEGLGVDSIAFGGLAY